MKVNPGWNYRPYQPLNHLEAAFNPYICRLAPFMTGTEVQLLDNGCPGCRHVVKVRPRGTLEPWQCVTVEGSSCVVDGLVSGIDYEIIAEREDDPARHSALRLFRTGEYPGRVVNYLHPDDDQYAFSGNMLGNPCIVKMPSGTLISSMDLFTAFAPQNLELIFRSKDGGKNWEYVTDLFPCYWGTLFLHKGVLYILATATEFGDILIGASYDEGETWTRPVRLFPGSGMFKRAGWQRQPMPILNYGGKLMTSIEYGSWWESDLFGIHTLWVDEDADLLDPASWNVSYGTHFDKSWPGSPKGGNPALLVDICLGDRAMLLLNEFVKYLLLALCITTWLSSFRLIAAQRRAVRAAMSRRRPAPRRPVPQQRPASRPPVQPSSRYDDRDLRTTGYSGRFAPEDGYSRNLNYSRDNRSGQPNRYPRSTRTAQTSRYSSER